MQRVYRLKSSKGFDYVYSRGQSVSDRTMVLMYVKNRSGHLKAGFTVSKKIGKSVVRNKVRRRLKEAFRSLIPVANKGYTYIVLARSPIAQTDYLTILNSLTALMKRAGLLIGANESDR
jgi:ribonuclease P protein component